MDKWELDSELERLGARVGQLSRGVKPNPAHKAQLRQELLHRHRELLGSGKHGRGHSFFARLGRLKRLTIIAPPAIASAVACLLLVWGLQISGHQSSQAVEAAPIARALIRTAPTVTSWEWTLRQNTNGHMSVHRMRSPLGAFQRLYIVSGRSYLYSNGKWMLIVPGQGAAPSAFDWQWAIASIAAKLADKKFTPLGNRVTDGRVTAGIQYTVDVYSGKRIVVVGWLDRKSGLVTRLERTVFYKNRVLERDSADYTYVRSH
ncbi:MAG: hypothetical protein NVSMB52_16100 [Chloroflexota bacterium]